LVETTVASKVDLMAETRDGRRAANSAERTAELSGSPRVDSSVAAKAESLAATRVYRRAG